MTPTATPPATTSGTATAAAPTGGTGSTGGSGSTSPLPTGTPGRPRVVATGLDVPWSVAPLPDGAVLVSLRDEARVVRVSPDGTVTPVRAPGPDGRVPDVVPGGEGGLLGLALAPDDPTVLYAYASHADENVVTRWRLDGDRLTDPRRVLAGIPRASTHNGGRIAFGPDGHLYVGTGDAQDRSAAQDPASLAGKVLRVTADGAPAPGNPDAASPVWSLGHRNVQGLGWSADGTMYASEFGQNRLDELNRIVPGADYGWPEVEGGGGGPGLTDPLVTWPVAEASPSGIAVTGDAVLLAALRGTRLWRVPLVAGGVGAPEPYLVGEWGRLRDVVVAPGAGAVWVLTNDTARGEPDADDDRLLLVPLG
ncbi:PQQ-dependent sugar dehydrogenase [Thalassiella azotivora]